MSQTERILYLDRKIRLDGRVTVAQAAEKFQVSTRQIKRDIEYLRDRFDAPLVYDNGIKAYRYEEKFNDLQFADQNLITSYLALQSISRNHDLMPVYAENMLTAIKAEVPGDYEKLIDKIIYQIPQSDSIKPEFFEDICSSMRDGIMLKIKYTSLKGEETERKIEPLRIINYGGSWYVVSWDSAKEDIRTFHLSRISSISLTNEKFSKHPASFQKKVDDFVTSGFGIFHGAKTSLVKIRFYDKAMRIVSTQTWHPAQKITTGKDENGSEYIEFVFPAADYTELISKLLSFGSNARPVSPPELVKLWKQEIKSLYNSID